MRRCLLAGVVVMGTTTVATADTPRTARLVAAGSCDLTALEARSNELLGRTAISPDARAQLGVFATEESGALSATLTLLDEDGVGLPARTVTAANCDELVDALAVVVSLVLRQDVAEPVPPRATSPAPPPAPPPLAGTAPAAGMRDEISPPVTTSTSTRVIELGATSGTQNESALVLGGRVQRERSAMGVELQIARPTTMDLGPGTVHVTSARVDAIGCLHGSGLGACAFAMGGLVRARGDDLMDARTAVRPIAGLGLRLEWRQHMSRRLGVRVFADVAQLLVTTRFLVDDLPVWTSDSRQAWLGAGMYLRVP